MQRRVENTDLVGTSGEIKPEGMSSNMKLMLIAAAFLAVTIGLILMQPGADNGQLAQAQTSEQDTNVQAVATSLRPPASIVSRSETSLLSVSGDLGDAQGSAEEVSRRLRQPIRLTDTNATRQDLRSLTATVLAGFGHATRRDDALHRLLVQALAEGQSDAYIDALLNTAALRGEFKVPVALQSASGRMETQALLHALIVQSGS